MTVLATLSSIASQQAKATESTLGKLKHLMDYLATHPDATVRFRASDMVLNIHSDASYLSEPGGKSRAAGHFFLGWLPHDGDPIRLNGAFFTLSTIPKFVAASERTTRRRISWDSTEPSHSTSLGGKTPSTPAGTDACEPFCRECLRRCSRTVRDTTGSRGDSDGWRRRN